MLLHLNSASGSTVTDATGNGHDGTITGGSISTGTKKFGAGSFDGTGNESGYPATEYVSVSGVGDFDFGSDSLTIDFWIKATSFNTFGAFVFGIGEPTYSNYFQMGGNPMGSYGAISTGGVVSLGSSTSDFSTSAWNHVAIVRDAGSSWYLFVGGVLKDTDDDSSPSAFPDWTTLRVAREFSYYRFGVMGYIDEFRIVKGVAVWTSGFTPPTSEY